MEHQYIFNLWVYPVLEEGVPPARLSVKDAAFQKLFCIHSFGSSKPGKAPKEVEEIR